MKITTQLPMVASWNTTFSCMRFLFLMILFMNLGNHAIQAQTPINFNSKQPFLFEENKGQMVDGNGYRSSDIKYYGKQNGVNVYLHSDKISFVFTKVEGGEMHVSEATGTYLGIPLPKGAVGFGNTKLNPQNSKISTSRMDLILVGSNPSTQIIPSDQQEYYENFYTSGNANHGISHVHTYKIITYNNVYPHIDMILSIDKASGMEYSFLVHAGGKASDIKLQWNGRYKAENLEDGGIQFSNTLGRMEEDAPKSFVERKVISSSFIRKGNIYGFKVGTYNKSKDLLIDPSLAWGTYLGSSAEDWATGVSTDASGNVYILGETQGTIATSGAYQTAFLDNQDAFLAKFSSTGNLAWATYYGSNVYTSTGISIDASSQVYITGSTRSSTGMATSGAFQTSNGGEGAFLAKFTNSGGLIWATYFGGADSSGGASNTQGLGISSDISGNVFITGTTTSKSNLASSGSFQSIYAGGGDAYLAKFSTTGSFLWSTYYGGEGAESGNSVSTDQNGNAYITGNTTSNNSIATSGSHQTSYGGGTNDVFVAKFSSSGNLSWATYYGGSGNDQGLGISADASGNIYITGSTNSSNGIATSGAHQTTFGGSGTNNVGDVFIAKFRSSGILSWSTYFGGNADDAGYGIHADGWGSIYITGYSKSNTGIATTGAYLTSNTGGWDAFLAKFADSGILSWATYYGGSQGYEGNEGFGVTSDPFGNIYMGGLASSKIGIATSGSYQSSYSGDNWDAFLAKFNFQHNDDAGVSAILYSNVSTCNSSQTIKVQLKNYGLNDLQSVRVGWSVNGKVQTPISWSTVIVSDSSVSITLGNYTFKSENDILKAWSYLPNGNTDQVPQNDTLIGIDTVLLPPFAKFTILDSVFCLSDSLKINNLSSNVKSYDWDYGDGNHTSTAYPQHLYKITGSYTIKLRTTSSSGCKDSQSISIYIDSSCVWPGDANSDKIVNVYDVLAIGIAYNYTGSKRPDATTNWYAHGCRDWAYSFESGVNHKNADCNGDGIVDSSDLTVIALNSTKTHLKSPGVATGNLTDPPLSIKFSKDSALAGDTVQVAVSLGSSTIPASNVYGIAMKIGYNSISSSKAVLADYSNSWLGTINKNMVSLIINDSSNNSIDLGITRTDHKDASGYGQIAVLSIIMPENLGGKREVKKYISFNIESYKCISANEKDVPLNPIGDSILAYEFKSGMATNILKSSALHIYPNPANNVLNINSDNNHIKYIVIHDLFGKVVYSAAFSSDNSVIDINALSKGMYVIDITTDSGAARSKFVKE